MIMNMTGFPGENRRKHQVLCPAYHGPNCHKWMVIVMEAEDFKFIYLLTYLFFVTNQVKESEALNPFCNITNKQWCAIIKNVMKSLPFNKFISHNVKMT